MELFNQITPTAVLASLSTYLYLVVLSTLEQFLSSRDVSKNLFISALRSTIYMIAVISGVYTIGVKFGFEDPMKFYVYFMIFYPTISIGIRITSVMNMRVNASPFLAYVYYPSLLIFWILMSSISANVINNLMQLRNCISQLGNLHTFRRFPKWYVAFLNKLYWIGLSINYGSSDVDSVESTYKYSHIKYARSVGRANNVREMMLSLIESDIFKEISNDLKEKHEELAEEIEKADKSLDAEALERIDREIREKGYSDTAESLGLKLYNREERKKILYDTTSDKKE
jgi:hypothetical protein|nr:MAG TPA: hypothetical protein [Bacteriophage sp.]